MRVRLLGHGAECADGTIPILGATPADVELVEEVDGAYGVQLAASSFETKMPAPLVPAYRRPSGPTTSDFSPIFGIPAVVRPQVAPPSVDLTTP